MSQTDRQTDRGLRAYCRITALCASIIESVPSLFSVLAVTVQCITATAVLIGVHLDGQQCYAQNKKMSKSIKHVSP